MCRGGALAFQETTNLAALAVADLRRFGVDSTGISQRTSDGQPQGQYEEQKHHSTHDHQHYLAEHVIFHQVMPAHFAGLSPRADGLMPKA